MITAPQHNSLAEADCEIVFDNLTRQLYATDASIYQIEPMAVGVPAQRATGQLRHPRGCCGMAGAFGALDSKYELSLKVAEPLVRQISAQRSGATIIASGTSCRHQIEHLTPIRPKHMAELLAEALA